MSSKIDISCIIRDHFATMCSERTKSFDWIDGLTFFLLPIVVALVCIYKQVVFNENTVVFMITAASIFSGLLINVLVLIYSINERPESKALLPTSGRVKLEKEFLREIFSNISFSILISMLFILTLAVLIFVNRGYFTILISGLAVALGVNFSLTVLMALKRIHILLAHKLK